MPGLENDVLVAKNVNFNYTSNPPHVGVITADAQLLIGSVTSHPTIAMQAGNLVSDGSITITYQDPNIKLVAAGGMTTQTITPDVGVPVNPVAGTIGVKGSVGTLPTDSILTHNEGNPNVGIENLRWFTPYVVDPSATIGLRGTYTTIQSAVTAASGAGGGTVFIRPGTYTENVTLAANVNLVGFSTEGTGSLSGTGRTIINGKLLHNTTGNVTIANLTLKTNGTYLLEVSGANDSSIFLENVYFDITDNTAILHSSSGTSEIDIRYSEGEITAPGIAFLTKSSASDFKLYWCDIRNIGATATNSTVSAGQLAVRWSRYYQGITTSGTGFITGLDSQFDNFGAAVVPLTLAGTGTNDSFKNCFINGNSQACCTIAAGSTARFTQCCFETTASPVISGAGSVVWSDLGFDSTGRGITVTTQTPRNYIPGAVTVTTPGAYPYTAVPQDCLILVDTSVARTINLNASPVTGQTYRIKDNVGSAAANNITITPAAGNIDGAASASIASNYGSVDVCYNGTMWNIL